VQRNILDQKGKTSKILKKLITLANKILYKKSHD